MFSHQHNDMFESLATLCREHHCAQIMIQRDNEILVDQVYREDPVDVYAVQKGLIAIMVGVAQEQYLLEVHDNMNHHVDPEWTRLGPWDEARLTIEHLLTMTTGMSDALEAEGEIGKSWRYNNVAYQQLKLILEIHTGLSLNEVSRQWLFEPLGMDDTEWRTRDLTLPDGRPMSALFSTARDLVKLGEVILHDGKPVLADQHYLGQLAAPGSSENPAWGFLWWNNNQDHYMEPGRNETYLGRPLPKAPADLVSARGALGNHLGISREQKTIVAITTQGTGDQPRKLEQAVWEILGSI